MQTRCPGTAARESTSTAMALFSAQAQRRTHTEPKDYAYLLHRQRAHRLAVDRQDFGPRRHGTSRRTVVATTPIPVVRGVNKQSNLLTGSSIRLVVTHTTYVTSKFTSEIRYPVVMRATYVTSSFTSKIRCPGRQWSPTANKCARISRRLVCTWTRTVSNVRP